MRSITFNSNTQLLPLWNLLSGHPADQENSIQEIPPIFYHCFSKKKNLKTWKACGAVPCTHEALKHRSVQQELDPMDAQIVAEDSEQVAVLMEYNGGNLTGLRRI
jgi:hypothetical protein